MGARRRDRAIGRRAPRRLSPEPTEKEGGAQDADFPDSDATVLTHFSHVCSLTTVHGTMDVADSRAVMTGMNAPRGLNAIRFFERAQRARAPLRPQGPVHPQSAALVHGGHALLVRR